MVTARDVIERGLRLINVPGRGALLSAQDTAAALDTLKDLLAAEGVSHILNPGIRRHFFGLTAGVSDYRYGPGARAPNFDTLLFGDNVPIRIESAYIRAGGRITDRERVTNGDFFEGSTGWTTTGPQWIVLNGQATIQPGGPTSPLSTLTQDVAVAEGETVELKLRVVHRAGGVRAQVTTAIPGTLLDTTISSSGTFRFLVTGDATGVASITLTNQDNTASADVDDVSVLPFGLDRFELSSGSDYILTPIDQKTYNRRHTKAAGGRPCRFLWSRAFPLAEVRFDHTALAGDVLIMDVLVNSAMVDGLESEMRAHPDAIEFIKYALAYRMAGEYGKMLDPTQLSIMRSAYDRMAAANLRPNNLRVDPALQSPSNFDIDRGDYY